MGQVLLLVSAIILMIFRAITASITLSMTLDFGENLKKPN